MDTEEVLIAVRAQMHRRAEQYITQAKKRKTRGRIVAGLSVVVALATTYALMLPGITMEREAQCGLEAHQHTQACYVSSLICTEEERAAVSAEMRSYACAFRPHEHTDECYNDEHELGCGQTNEYFHRHDEWCVSAEGDLLCTLKEKVKPNHTTSCYEDVSTLICETQEAEGHRHTAACYAQQAAQEPGCGSQENAGHVHTEDCATLTLICTAGETAGHAHTEACMKAEQTLTCTEAETAAHHHGEECYQAVVEKTCGKTEGEGAHAHDAECYMTETKLICGKTEGEDAHSHGEGCFAEETLLACGEEHEHLEGCYSTDKKLICTTQESAGHIHGDDCRTVEEKLNCDMAENAGHIHDESCDTIRNELVCTAAETDGHTHNDACYTLGESIICALAEGEGAHAHSDECYAAGIGCGMAEGEGAHIHDSECYPVEDVLTCGLAEGEGSHQHGEDCYVVESARTCSHDELHEHTPGCYVTDKNGKLWAVCGLVELETHQHNEKCINVETMTEAGHTHGDSCYVQERSCALEEHEHTDACYPDATEEPAAEPAATPKPVNLTAKAPAKTTNAVQKTTAQQTGAPVTAADQIATESDLQPESYRCGLNEHVHDNSCLDENWNIVCGMDTHQHTGDCCYCCGLATHTHSTGVQGGIMLLDVAADGCFDEDGNLICTLTEHTHSEACSLASAEDVEILEENGSDKFDLTVHKSDVSYVGDTAGQELRLEFAATYTVPKSLAQTYTKEKPLVLPLEGLDVSQLILEDGAFRDAEGQTGMKYRFVETEDGYAMEIYYTEEGLEQAGDPITGSIEFNAWIDTDKTGSDGSYDVQVGDEEITVKPTDIIYPTPGESLNYDISTGKTGQVDLTKNKLAYTITVETTKGFPQVTLSDVLTLPDGLTVTGGPTITGMKLESWEQNYSNYVLTEYSEFPALGAGTNFTLTLDGVTLTQAQTNAKYTITVEYDISDVSPDYTGNVSNSVTAEAKDPATGETVRDEATDNRTVSNTVVAKGGWYDQSTGLITWSITLNPNYKDIAGDMVSDPGFLEGMGLTGEILAELEASAVTDESGAAVLMDQAALTAYLAGKSMTISPAENVSLVKKDGEYYLVFEADENGTNTNKYVITYQTDPDETVTNTAVRNTYTYLDKDTGSSITGGAETYVSGGAVKKTYTNAAQQSGADVYRIDWKSVITLPDGGVPAGSAIEDNLDSPTVWVNNVNTLVRWYTYEQVQALYDSIKDAPWAQALDYTFQVKTVDQQYNWVDFSTVAAGTKLCGWRICVNSGALTPWTEGDATEEQSQITFEYSSMMDAGVVNSSSVSSRNEIIVGSLKAEATYTRNYLVAKKDGNGQMGDSSKTVTVDGNTITWVVEVYLNDDYEQVVIKDTLPPAITVNGSEVGLELAQIRTGEWTGTEFNYTDDQPDTATRTEGVVPITVSPVTQNNEVTVTIQPAANSWAAAGKTVKVQFICKLPDSVFENLTQTEEAQTIEIGKFTNNVSVSVKKADADATDYGSDDQSQTVSVYIPPMETADKFGKTGEYIDFQSADQSDTGKQKTHVLEYSVDINRFAENLDASGSTLTVQDVMTHRTANFINWGSNCWAQLMMTATLDVSSVKLYYAQRNENGELIYNEDGSLIRGDEVSKGLWRMSYTEAVSDKNNPAYSNTAHTLELKVPDDEAFVLEYNYSIEIDTKNPVNRCTCGSAIPESIPLSGGESGFSNVLKYNSTTQASHSTDGNDVWQASGSSVTMDIAMTIYKVDEHNESQLLSGAKFAVYAWDGAGFVETGAEYTTEDGFFRLQKEAPGGYQYQNNTAYYMVETQAPFGYELPADPEPLYFYFRNADTAAYPACGPDGFMTSGAYLDLSGGGEKVYIPNARNSTSVNVQKTWSPNDGSVTIPGTVDMYLYRYALNDAQWNAVNSYEAPDGEGGNTQTYTASLSYLRQYTRWDNTGASYTEYVTLSDEEIVVPAGYTLIVDFNTGNALYATKSLLMNGQDVREQISGEELRIENVSSDIVLEGISDWDESFWSNISITMLVEEPVAAGPAIKNVYTADTLQTVLGSTALQAAFDGSFSRVMHLSGDSWSGAWTDLELLGKDENGNTLHYVYYVEEKAVEGWSSSITGGGSDEGYAYSVTNTYDGSTQTTTNLSVAKVWKDAAGNVLTDGDEVKVQLYRKVAGSDAEPTLFIYDGHETTTINSATGWRYNFTGLPHTRTTASGTITYEYTVKEITTGDFVTTYETGNDGVVTITNKRLAEQTEIHVRKDWAGKSTTAVRVYLRRYRLPSWNVDVNGAPTVTPDETHKDTAYNADNALYVILDGTTTTGAFRHLEKSAAVDGTTYHYFYYVEEEATDAANYTVSYAGNDGSAGNTADNPIVVTNTEKTADAGLAVIKAWKNADGSQLTGGIPESVSFRLMRVGSDGAETQYPDADTIYTLSAANGWRHEFQALPQQSDDGTITYTYKAVEDPVPEGYAAAYTSNGIANGEITITNTATQLSISKAWLETDGTTAWTEHQGTIVYLQLIRDDTALTRDELLRYVSAELVTDAGCLKITGAGGMTLKALPMGSYTVKEAAYSTDGGTTVIMLTGDAAPEWNINDDDSSTLSAGSLQGSITVKNTARTRLTVNKVWNGLEENEAVPYTVYMRVKDGEGNAVDLTGYVPAGSLYATGGETWLVYTGAGSITLSDLPAGAYSVEEVAYQAGGDASITMITAESEPPFTIDCPADTVTLGAAELTVTNTMPEELPMGSLRVKKEWASGTSQREIAYDLYQYATGMSELSTGTATFRISVMNDANTATGYDTLNGSQTTLQIINGSTIVWSPTWVAQDTCWTLDDLSGSVLYVNGAARDVGAIGKVITTDNPWKTVYTINVGTINAGDTIDWRLPAGSWFNASTTPERYWTHGFDVTPPAGVTKTVFASGTLNAGNNWQATVEVPLRDENGNLYTYAVKETTTGYVVTYSSNNGGAMTGEANGTLTITNDNLPAPIDFSLTVEKQWAAADGSPLTSVDVSKVTFALKRDMQYSSGKELVGEFELTAANGWKCTFNDLLVMDEWCNPYSYYVEEVRVYSNAGDVVTTFNATYSLDGNQWLATSDEAKLTVGVPPYDAEGNTTYTPGDQTMYVKNTVQGTYVLPGTGGAGTQWYTGGGAMLIGIALMLLYKGNKRKRRAEE